MSHPDVTIDDIADGNDLSPTDCLLRVTQWVDPSEWFAVLDPYSGDIWPTLCHNRHEAQRIADELRGGTVVVVTTRIGADDEGEYIAPRFPDRKA